MVKLFLGAALLATAGGFTYKEASRYQSTERQLGQIASVVAKRQVEMKCQGVVKEAVDISSSHGEVEFDERGRPAAEAKLRRGVCRAIADFPKTKTDPALSCLVDGSECPEKIADLVDAAHTAAHESWHLAGIQDEKIAECHALQTTAWWAVKLGADEPLARAMASYAAIVIYPKLSQEYQSGDCRDGGKLDLNPASRSWPT